jgi:chromosome segregation protein
MRLKKIKLNGFKSFVEPTTIELGDAELIAIVGPNGCGKSNVIDAVRWVMGESSAKQLRGTAMSDVIFNGSSNRKPLSQASIELFFDNSDASLGGEYAGYNEIAICREIERDGMSTYYLNGTRCRRKDIIDIFLGTGLGPDSYAIIEQGMISQFVEAKPDDLRIYLEEAAGISRYKERRKETESKIKSTRDNLARLTDIREELERQLKHLKSQANAAERYKKLKQNERLTKAKLHALRWQELTAKLAELVSSLKHKEAHVEDKTAEQYATEAQITQEREAQIASNDAFNEVQGRYYSIGANIARLEQKIHSDRERKEQLQQELDKIDQEFQETLQHKTNDEGQIELLQADLQKITQESQSLLEQATQTQQAFRIAENKMQEWQNAWNTFQAEEAAITRTIEVEQTNIQHLEKTIAEEIVRLEKLETELASFAFENLQDEIKTLETQHLEIKAQNEALHAELQVKQQEITAARGQCDKLNSELDVARGNLQTLLGRQASLDALHRAALGQNDAEFVKWLEQYQLADKPRLVDSIKVLDGWESAVEMVLGSFLEAIGIHGFEGGALGSLQSSLPRGNLMVFDLQGKNDANDEALHAKTMHSQNGLSSLLSKVAAESRNVGGIAGILSNIYIANNLDEALALRSTLAPFESIITADGLWFGKSWLKLTGNASPEKGILQCARELQELKITLAEEETKVASKEQELQQAQELLEAAERQYHELQQQLQMVATQVGELQGGFTAKQQQLNYLQERKISLEQELQTHRQKMADNKQKLAEASNLKAAALEQKNVCDSKRTALLAQQEQFKNDLENARNLAEQSLKAKETAKVRADLIQTQLEYLRQNLERAAKRVADLGKRREEIFQVRQVIDEPTVSVKQELEDELMRRLSIEDELQVAKSKVAAIDEELRKLEQKRAILQEEISVLKTGLEKLRMEHQEAQLKSVTHQEAVAEMQYVMDALLLEIESDVVKMQEDVATDEAEEIDVVSEDASTAVSQEVVASEEIFESSKEKKKPTTILAWLEDKLARFTRRIDRLGPINLAAINECEELQKRKEYLDTQNQDLVSALDMLADAMQKIDRETKERFKDIFASVNQHFQEIFPKIFNGGRASLELIGDDDLETGVVITAQPPGKRNSSIHLLSGGEKALTAIALIFAIFRLNPAPFCMLDEVDAPLDDNNVQRFCNLLREISATIQLIFISHNKLTLSVAQKLTGVTMQEAGVSRIVSVDIDKALAMVENDAKQAEA